MVAGEQSCSPVNKHMKEKLEIGIWSSPKNTLEDYRILKECGVTHAFIDENYCPRGSAEYLNILAYCRQVGLKAYVFNYNDAQKFLDDTTDYASQEAFAGIVMFDEPDAGKFDEIASLIPEFERRYPDGVFYVNLLPNYAVLYEEVTESSSWFGVDRYEDYVEQYCRKVLDKLHGKKILSVDFYPLVTIPEEGKVFLEKGWLRNLEVVARCAKAHDALPYYYIQSTSFGLWRRMPQRQDFSYQYFVCLSYGARGINHFTYTSPLGGEFAPKDLALIDRAYQPTPRYWYVKELNERIQPLCEELFSYTYVGTMALQGSGSLNWREKENLDALQENLTEAEGISACLSDKPILVGVFEKTDNSNHLQKKRAYLLTNFTDPYRNENALVDLQFTHSSNYRCIYKGNETQGTGKSISLRIDSGEGVLILVDALL